MSNIMYSIFSNKKINLSKLLQFGFVQTESGYIYRKTLSESGFLLNVHVTPQGEISTEIIDPSLNELYTLHLVGHATGGFVETVKYEYPGNPFGNCHSMLPDRYISIKAIK